MPVPGPAVPVSDRVAILLGGEFVKKALPLCRTALHPLVATAIAPIPADLFSEPEVATVASSG